MPDIRSGMESYRTYWKTAAGGAGTETSEEHQHSLSYVRTFSLIILFMHQISQTN